MTTASTVLQANLKRVFNERNATRRRHAIEELYAADAVLYEQQGKYSGTEATTAQPLTRHQRACGDRLFDDDNRKRKWRDQNEQDTDRGHEGHPREPE